MDRSKSSISHYFLVSQVLYSCCTSSSEYHRQYSICFSIILMVSPLCVSHFWINYIPLYIPYAISFIRTHHTIPLTLVMITINLIYALPANIKHYNVSIFHYGSWDSVWIFIIRAHRIYPTAFPYSMKNFHCWTIWTTIHIYIYILYVHMMIFPWYSPHYPYITTFYHRILHILSRNMSKTSFIYHMTH